MVSFSWTIDLTAPPITFSGAPVDPSNTATASFTFFADRPNSFTCQIDGQAIDACQPDPSDPGNAAKGTKGYSGLAEGPHTFTVTATDAAGNVASLGFNWTIDLTASPTLSMTSAPLDPTPSNTANFRFQSGEASTFDCQLDAAIPGTHGSCDPDPDDTSNPAKGAKSYTGLSEGAYTFTVTATDGAGNPSTQTYSWVIDAQAPSVVFDTPSPGPNTHGWNNTDVSISLRDPRHRCWRGRHPQHIEPAGALDRRCDRDWNGYGDRSCGEHRIDLLARREDRQDGTHREYHRAR